MVPPQWRFSTLLPNSVWLYKINKSLLWISTRPHLTKHSNTTGLDFISFLINSVVWKRCDTHYSSTNVSYEPSRANRCKVQHHDVSHTFLHKIISIYIMVDWGPDGKVFHQTKPINCKKTPDKQGKGIDMIQSDFCRKSPGAFIFLDAGDFAKGSSSDKRLHGYRR